MKGSYSEEEEEEDQFFDSREEISSVSGWSSDCSDDCSSCFRQDNCLSRSLEYDFWIGNPQSVVDRRHKFLRWMSLGVDQGEAEESRDEVPEKFFPNEFETVSKRVMEDSGAVLRTSGSEDVNLWSQSSLSSWENEAVELLDNSNLDENLVNRIKNLDDGTEFIIGELGQDGMFKRLHEVGTNRSVSVEEFQRNLGSSPLVQQLMQRDNLNEARVVENVTRKIKKGWLRKLGCMVPNFDIQASLDRRPSYKRHFSGGKMERVRVHSYKKRSKELSSLYAGQEILAHEGAITAMKFSLDGQYLASAGEDGVVRVWKVIQDENFDRLDVSNPSCVHFKMDQSSKIAPLDVDKVGKVKGLARSSDMACVIFPPKIFRILEKPLHEFRGHDGEVLDLCWSQRGYLLSSSVDKTARLWQVGCDRCLGVFWHNNYVTSVHFNPVDENFFISGSIDGKVRIWEVLGCRVADYIDIREIVTAVCYRPDGKGGIVGTMTGNCRFYDIIDNQLQLDTEICLQRKKKTPGKRIIGFQFSPGDPRKVIVTSADSLVRVLCGTNVVCKLRGLRSTGSHLFASFTSDGRHILSVNDDSNVCIWNYTNSDGSSTKKAKNIRSCEHFFAHNACLAIPWCGLKAMPGTLPFSSFDGDMHGDTQETGHSVNYLEQEGCKMSLSSPDCFFLARGFLLDSLLKGPATWPEEKLPESSPGPVSSAMCKSEYKFLKNACQSILSSPHLWGLVMVTAGWDGHIRTYHNYGLPMNR